MVLTNGARLSTEQSREISSVRRDYGSLSSYANYFLRPQDAAILAKGNGKKLHEIYRQVATDPRIYAALTQRFGAAIGREIVVEAASDRRIDKKAADEVRLQIKNLGRRSTERSNKAAVYSFGGFENATLTFLDARFVGYSVVEIDWAIEGDRVVARQLWGRESSRFTFDIADGGWELRLITPESPLNGIALPPKKFLLTCVNSHDDSPYGDGLANKLFWLSWLKRQIQKWWAIFCDKHGSPTLLGEYETPAQRDRLIEVMQGISQQAGVALPKGVTLGLLQAASTGTDVYSAFCGYCDTQAVEAILLQNLTTNITGGSYAASETHLEIRQELVDMDCSLLSDGPYADLSRWICEFNYPDAEPPLIYRPRVKVADEARARRDTALVSLVGRPLTEEYLRSSYDASFLTEEEVAKKQEEQAAKEAELAAQNPPTTEDPNAEQPFVFSESLIRVGTAVSWKYGTGTATGKVVKVYRSRITLKLGNSEITRNGSEDDPAILIEQENGARALKLVSEVRISSSDYAEEEKDTELDPADLYTEQAYSQATPIFSEWLETLEDHLFTGAEDLGEVRDRIDSAFGEMDSKDFAALMQSTLLASYGAGRYQVGVEAEDDEDG
ncbi:phage portal protein family protein [Chroococcidiopsis sp.]|uniref:phage portal protein family protein n=1 Tax=Chroococcidiopsis sp. TaxID=3088168 RepID=UPI003F409026